MVGGPLQIDVGDARLRARGARALAGAAGRRRLLGGVVRTVSRARPDPRAAGRRARRRLRAGEAGRRPGAARPPSATGCAASRWCSASGRRAGGRVPGAQPEAAVRQFLARLLPTEADRLARRGDELAAAGHANAAEERYREALASERATGPRCSGWLAHARASAASPTRRSSCSSACWPPAASEAKRSASPRSCARAASPPPIRPRSASAPGARSGRPRRAPRPRPRPRRRGDYEAALGELLALVERDPELRRAGGAPRDARRVRGAGPRPSADSSPSAPSSRAPCSSERGAAAARLPAPAELPRGRRACPSCSCSAASRTARPSCRGRPLPPVLLRAGRRPPAPSPAEAGARVTPSALRDLRGGPLLRVELSASRRRAAAPRAPRGARRRARSRRTCASRTAT